MVHPLLWCLVTLIFGWGTTPGSAWGAAKRTDGDIGSFLRNIAEQQLFDVSVGELAAQRARDRRIKELATLVAEDHKTVSRQLEQLAYREGVTLSPELRPDDQRMLEHLSQLYGDAFDREYVKYLLQNHEKAVKALEQEVPMLQDGPIKHWMISTIPLLESHRISARLTQYALFPNP